MNLQKMWIDTLRHSVVVLGLVVAASPAAAQWSRVLDVPEDDVINIQSNGDTLVAGTIDRAYVSTNAGASWQASARPAGPSGLVQSVLLRNGKLYAGTAGAGVFVSSNLGQTWQAFNQGLVGGFLDTQLDVGDLQVRGDSLYAATFGAGVYVRNIAAAGTWSHFGETFEPNQASNVEALAVGGTRLLAMAGGNGTVFFREPGAPEWTQSFLDNEGLEPGFQASSAAWTGTSWVVGVRVARGIFRSTLGQEPWTFVNLNIGILGRSALVTQGHHLFGAFDLPNSVVIEQSDDDGATWQLMEVLPNTFVYRMAVSGNQLFAARADGLWRRATDTTSVPGDAVAVGLRFALLGSQPVGDAARVHFEMPEAGNATIDVFDVTGRRVADPIRQSFSAGRHEATLSARNLGPGVYLARLTAGNRQEALRLVHVR